MKWIHAVIVGFSIEFLQFLIIHSGKRIEVFIFRRKESRTGESAPLTGISNLITEFFTDVTGNHSSISGEYRLNTQLPHTGYDLLLKRFLLLIPAIGIRSTPTLQIIHLPPSHKGRAGNKFIDFFCCVSQTFQQIVPDHLHSGDAQRHIDAMHCHPVYFFFPTLPIPENHGIRISAIVQIISVLHGCLLTYLFLWKR